MLVVCLKYLGFDFEGFVGDCGLVFGFDDDYLRKFVVSEMFFEELRGE